MNLNNLKKLAIELFPLNRSLAGKYNRQTLTMLKQKVDKRFSIKGVKSGLQVYSWKIPYEYNVTKGLLMDDENNIICDFKKSFSFSHTCMAAIKDLNPLGATAK